MIIVIFRRNRMDNNNKNRDPNHNRQGWGIILVTTLLVTFMVMGLYSMMRGSGPEEISYDKFLTLIDDKKVQEVSLNSDRIYITLTDEARQEELEENGQIHTLFRCKESGFLHDHFIARPYFPRADLPREAGGERDHAVSVHGRITVLEECLAGEHPAKRLPDPSVRRRLHLHIRRHPAHGSPLCYHGFPVFQIADHYRKFFAFDLVFHMLLLSPELSSGQLQTDINIIS